MADRQTSLVRHIWLCIQPRAILGDSFTDFPFIENQYNNPTDSLNTIRETIERLFSSFSTWDADRRPGLSLDLCVYYPNDLHLFPGDHFKTEADGDRTLIVGDSTSRGNPLSTIGADDSFLYGTDMRFETHPKVNIVTSLVVRRQMRCRFTPDSFCRLLRKLPRLEHLCYELRNEDDLAYVSGAEPGKYILSLEAFPCYADH